ncbi:MAG: single-stranded-DNA-specific exonuclease RecJ [Bacteroidota bacterium]
MEKRWIEYEVPDQQVVGQLSSALNLNEHLTSLLVQRGIKTFDQAKKFFRPSLAHLYDPFLMKDMEMAVNRLCDAVHSGEKILIYGDYDVDGTTSVAMTYNFIREFTDQISYYIPDRYSEGYGISEKGVRWAKEEGYSLMIALDCGIRAVNNIGLAKELGLDVIVCDHHLPGEELPPALAILDPKRKDDAYPFKELSGCGVGFKLLQGFCLQNTVPLERLYNYLDFVAVSIASDIVPIVDENRVLTFYGVKKLNHAPSPGLKSLIEISGLKVPIGISDIVFYIGPRINATGRLSHARESVRLLISDDEKELSNFADHLNSKNTERRDFDQTTTAEALEMIESDEKLIIAKSTVLFKNDWHKGVVGIVASRCIEKYYRPTIILTESNGKITGSARSVDGFNLYEAIKSCEDLLEQFGGHTHAAGLSLLPENLDDFKVRFEEVVSKNILEDQLIPKIQVDQQVNFDFINFKTLKIISQMAPFGPQNPQPIFVSSNVRVKGKPKVIKDQHLKLMLFQEGHPKTVESVGFGMAEKLEMIENARSISIAYHIDLNEYMGNKTIQLIIKDIKED